MLLFMYIAVYQPTEEQRALGAVDAIAANLSGILATDSDDATARVKAPLAEDPAWSDKLDQISVILGQIPLS